LLPKQTKVGGPNGGDIPVKITTITRTIVDHRVPDESRHPDGAGIPSAPGDGAV